jgi:hypothetical protein
MNNLRAHLDFSFLFQTPLARMADPPTHQHPPTNTHPPTPTRTDVADPRKLSSRAQEDRKLWTNPLSVALPKAPKMKSACVRDLGSDRWTGIGCTCTRTRTRTSAHRAPSPLFVLSKPVLCYYGVGKPTERAYMYKTSDNGAIDTIDTSVDDPKRNVSDGVFMGEGDGTVGLLSLGYHCAKARKKHVLRGHRTLTAATTTGRSN